MSTVRAKGKFTGENGSCGYETGKEYRLLITHKKRCNIIIESPDVPRKRGERISHDKDGYCEYSTLGALLNNWKDITPISDNEYFSKPGRIYIDDLPKSIGEGGGRNGRFGMGFIGVKLPNK